MHQSIDTDLRNPKTSERLQMLRCGALAIALWVDFALFDHAAADALSLAEAALPNPAEAIVSSGSAGPTLAWTEFCKSHPQECTVDGSEAVVVSLNQDLWLTILQVNERESHDSRVHGSGSLGRGRSLRLSGRWPR